METDDLTHFENDIIALAEQLKRAFASDKMRWFLHEQTNTLYIELSGLEDLSDEIISLKAEPILDELDLDFDEIILLPYA